VSSFGGAGTFGGADASTAGGTVDLLDDELELLRATVETGFNHSGIIQTFNSSGTDDFGNQTGTWVDGAARPCQLVHTSGREVTQDRDTQIADWFARFSWDTVITGHNRVKVDGVVYQVIGPPSDERTHIRVQLQHFS
jgi:hypothetical protein